MTAIGTAVLPKALKAAMPAKPDIGIQLYTVRDELQKDFKGTLRSLKRIGYSWLEAAGYEDGKFYGLEPVEFKKIVDGMGMKVISSHAMFNADQQKKAIAAHVALGVEYLVFPGFPVAEHKTRDDFMAAAARLNALGEACNKAGIKFGYHNHDFEFVRFDDTTGYDILVRSTDKKKVIFEADIYWMTYAGKDPLNYFNMYPGRFELWHVKDMKNTPDKGFTEVGAGIIPYKEYFQYQGLAGMKYFFVEQDECEIDPVESAAISFENLEQILTK